MSHVLLLMSLLAAPPVDGAAVADALARRAVEANADVAALQARVRALERHADSARYRPDPVLMAEWSNVPITEPIPGNHPMSGVGLKVQQKFVRPAKNDLREAAAQAAVEVGVEAVDELRLQLAGRVRRAYWRLALVRRLRNLTTTQIELLDQLRAVAQARYEVGKAGQQALLRLQVLRARLTDQLDDFGRDERRLMAQLDAALNRPAGQTVATPETLPDPPLSLGLGPAQALAEEAKGRRPALRKLLAKAQAKRAGAERVAYEAKPDLTAWAAYRLRLPAGVDDGDDFVSVGVGVPLPLDLDDRWEGQAAALRAEAEALERSHAARIVGLRGEIEAQLARRDRAARKVATYGAGLIPKAKETLKATLNAYQTDRADFASLFEAEVAVINLERDLDRARAAAIDAAIAVETLIGGRTP